jgi:MFS family permease
MPPATDEEGEMLKHVHNMTMVQPIRLPGFRRLFVGEGIAVFADQMLLVALTLLALRVAGPGFALGSVLAVAAIPGALLMPLGGWVSDRFSPAAVLLLCGIGRALLASALASMGFLDIVSSWPLYALAGALGVLNALYYPASLSTVPAVLKDKALLGAGNALVMGTQQVSEMAGPVLAASVVALFGVGAVFGVNALMFAVAAILFGLVASGTRHATQITLGGTAPFEGSSGRERRELAGSEKPSEASPGPVAGIAEGIRYAWRDPLLRTMLFALALLSFSTSGPLRVGGAMLAETRLGGAEAFGVLLSAFGAGSLIGLVVAGSLVRTGRRGLDLIVGTAALGLGLGTLGFASNLFLATALVLGMGVGAGYLGVVLMAWLQERTKPSLHGRVMSLMMFAAVAVDPLSYALMGALSGLDLRIMFAVAGSLLTITALLGAASRTVRSFR